MVCTECVWYAVWPFIIICRTYIYELSLFWNIFFTLLFLPLQFFAFQFLLVEFQLYFRRDVNRHSFSNTARIKEYVSVWYMTLK